MHNMMHVFVCGHFLFVKMFQFTLLRVISGRKLDLVIEYSY